MIEKFDSYEKAAMFVEKKRSEGFQAYIMNESTGFLWGPRTVGGFRVYVSEEPLPEGTPPEAFEKEPQTDDLVSKVIRTAVLIMLGIGIATAIISGLRYLQTTLTLIIFLILVLGSAILGGYFIFRTDFPKRPDS